MLSRFKIYQRAMPKQVIESIGLVGLEFLQYGLADHGPDQPLDELRHWYNAIIDAGMEAVSFGRHSRPRRPSGLLEP